MSDDSAVQFVSSDQELIVWETVHFLVRFRGRYKEMYAVSSLYVSSCTVRHL